MRPDRLHLSPPHLGGDELDYVKQAFEANFIAPLGPQLAEFEARFSELTGLAHCAALSSGTAAMHLALRCLGVGRGDVVAASSLTFIGSVSPATFLGADLHFVDSSPDTWNMDPGLLDQALVEIGKQGRRIGAVIPTDIYGQCADYDAIQTVCDRHDVPLIIDAAESVGATYKDRPAGCSGRAATYSFNGNKIMTTGGGGLLASDDKALVDEARWLSQQARDDAPHYEHSAIGYNYRMSNVAAAIGLGQLDMLETFLENLARINARYKGRLGELEGVSFMPDAAYGRPNHWLTVMLLDVDRLGVAPEDVRQALEAENIESRPVWKPMHLQPTFKGAGMTGGEMCEDLFRRGLCLPSGSAMTDADVDRVTSIVEEVVT